LAKRRPALLGSNRPRDSQNRRRPNTSQSQQGAWPPHGGHALSRRKTTCSRARGHASENPGARGGAPFDTAATVATRPQRYNVPGFKLRCQPGHGPKILR